MASCTTAKPFVFGDTPSSLDLLIYGHLILHLLPTMPDPILRTTIVESYPELAHYLHECHDCFTPRTQTVVIKKEFGWGGMFEGWGVEKGKRVEDLVGIGALIGGVIGYALWRAIRR